MEACNNSKKRVWNDDDDSLSDSAESKLRRLNSDVNSPKLKHIAIDASNSVVFDPDETNEIQDHDLLSILDDSDAVTDRVSTVQDLDSVIRSFEEEIHVPAPIEQPVDVKSDSGESQPDLGFLLKASDDELGLPPTNGSVSEEKIEAVDFATSSSAVVGFESMLGFENEIPSYDSFEFGIGNVDEDNDFGSNFVALGGLFDYWDGISESMFRSSESLPAL